MAGALMHSHAILMATILSPGGRDDPPMDVIWQWACCAYRSLRLRRLVNVCAAEKHVMPKTLATAAVDGLLHHAHVVLTDGDSFRLAQATAGKGVIDLTN